MGLVNSMIVKITRPLKNFNVDNRAMKVISKDKPIRAPLYKADQETLSRVLKENPNLIEELSRKNVGLDNRLKDVYVSSTDVQAIDPILTSDNRPLPLSKKVIPDHDYGVKEPEETNRGSVTLRNAIQFINDHKADTEKYSSTSIAEQYKLNQNDVENILEYYSSFETYIPARLQPEKISMKQKLLQAIEDSNKNNAFAQIDKWKSKKVENKS